MAPAKLRMKLRSTSGAKREQQATLASMLSGVPASGLNRAAHDPKPKKEEFNAMFKHMPKLAANAFKFASAYHTARQPGRWYPAHHIVKDTYIPRYGPTSMGPDGFDLSPSQRSMFEEEVEAAAGYSDDLSAWLARKQPNDNLPPLSDVLRKMDGRGASADNDSNNNAFFIEDDSTPDCAPSSRATLYKQAFTKMAKRFEASQSARAASEVAKSTTARSRKVIQPPGPKSAAASGQQTSKVQKTKGGRSKKSSPSHQTARKRPAKQQAPQAQPHALPANGTVDKNVEHQGPRETTEALFARLAAEASAEGGDSTVGTATRPMRTRKPSSRTGQ